MTTQTKKLHSKTIVKNLTSQLVKEGYFTPKFTPNTAGYKGHQTLFIKWQYEAGTHISKKIVQDMANQYSTETVRMDPSVEEVTFIGGRAIEADPQFSSEYLQFLRDAVIADWAFLNNVSKRLQDTIKFDLTFYSTEFSYDELVSLNALYREYLNNGLFCEISDRPANYEEVSQSYSEYEETTNRKGIICEDDLVCWDDYHSSDTTPVEPSPITWDETTVKSSTVTLSISVEQSNNPSLSVVEPVELVETINIPSGSYSHNFDITGRHEYIKKIVTKEVTLPGFKISNGPITRQEWQELAKATYIEGSDDNLPLNTWCPLAKEVHKNGVIEGMTPKESETYKSSINDMTKPAVGMTWLEANAFCKKLSELTGKIYTLPTEAQLTYCHINNLGAKNLGEVDQMCRDFYIDNFDMKLDAFPSDGTSPIYTDRIDQDLRVVKLCKNINADIKDICMSKYGYCSDLGFHVVCSD